MIISNYNNKISRFPDSHLYIELNNIMSHAWIMNDLSEIFLYFKQSNILEISGELNRKISKADPFSQTWYKSFLTNIRGLLGSDKYFANNQPQDNLLDKLNKVFVSFANFEYSSIIQDSIQNYLTHNDNQHSKLVLALSTVDFSSRLKINKEIANIYELSRNTNYLVIVSFGATVDVFARLIDKYDFYQVHISGHGKEERLSFVTSNIKPITFQNIFLKKSKMPAALVINTCSSYSFVKGFTKQISNHYISYPSLLSDSDAYDFSDIFYTSEFRIDQDIEESFRRAQMSYSNYRID